MSKRDLYDQEVNPNVEVGQNPYMSENFDAEAFSDIFHSDQIPEYEFEPDDSCVYIPPAEGMQLPSFDEEPKAATNDVPLANIAEIVAPDSAMRAAEEDISDVPPEDWYDSGMPEESDKEPDEEYDEEDDDEEEEPKPRKGRHVLHTLGHVLLGFLTFFSLLYLIAVYSNNPLITSLRNMYIQTAMTTLNHKYLATAIFPSDMIDDLMRMQYESQNAMYGKESNWGSVSIQSLPTFENETTELTGGPTDTETSEDSAMESSVLLNESNSAPEYGSAEEETFFNLFYEIDYSSMQEYVKNHPEVLENGWANININEAGLDDEGTEIQTVYGDQVLAINAQEGILLIRLNMDLSRGVMAICKDTSKLRLCAASTLGTIGQTIGRICSANGGILAIPANGFVDQNGEGNGGEISGVGVCSGKIYGEPIWGYKRIEIRDDNRMYIVDSTTEISSSVRDAVEFSPALVIDGEVVVDENCGWTGPHPRAAIGQTAYLETVMVVIEGRLTDSLGCSVVSIAEVMQKYGCVQALNQDGGTSALMYYNGEPITRCSNESLPGGRTVPTAWVYG